MKTNAIWIKKALFSMNYEIFRKSKIFLHKIRLKKLKQLHSMLS